MLANNCLIGGMTYRLDPDLSRPWNDRQMPQDCLAEAQLLAECLGIDQEIGKVRVKEIVVSLKVKKDDCCWGLLVPRRSEAMTWPRSR